MFNLFRIACAYSAKQQRAYTHHIIAKHQPPQLANKCQRLPTQPPPPWCVAKRLEIIVKNNGGGGSRTRVRKSSASHFYVCSSCFIPIRAPKRAGYLSGVSGFALELGSPQTWATKGPAYSLTSHAAHRHDHN